MGSSYRLRAWNKRVQRCVKHECSLYTLAWPTCRLGRMHVEVHRRASVEIECEAVRFCLRHALGGLSFQIAFVPKATMLVPIEDDTTA